MKTPKSQVPRKSKRADSAGFSFSRFAANVLLLACAVLLFALSHPNPLSAKGFPLLAHIAIVPLFVLARRVSFAFSFLWGAAYGLLCYCAYSYWLGAFHPLALYVVAFLYLLWMAVVVPLLKLAGAVFPRRGYILQWGLWIGYEYAKTLGFCAFSYGIMGYSQWSWPLVIQIASIFGVWGVSALVVFPSAWIGAGINASLELPCKEEKKPRHFKERIKGFMAAFKGFAARERAPAFCYLAFLLFALVFGALSMKDWSEYPTVKAALVQPNSDPWVGNIQTYRREFEKLRALSDEALASDEDIAFVVWPETAFIPRIEWHYKYREDRESFNLVSALLRYLDTAPVPFVLGNDDAERVADADGGYERLDYNSVFVFYPGENVIPPAPERYRKIHLVPFTEHFPYKDAFPWIYDILLASDTHFWEKGDEFNVFEIGDLKFSSPICFEDTFGYISREFVNAGARAIVNLTNDAWAKDICCQYQHLAMSVFRAVENRVPLVRSTATGQTASVDPNGRVVAMAKPFTETWLVAELPLVPQGRGTFYGLWGDLWGKLFLFASLVFLAAGAALYTLRNRKKA